MDLNYFALFTVFHLFTHLHFMFHRRHFTCKEHFPIFYMYDSTPLQDIYFSYLFGFGDLFQFGAFNYIFHNLLIFYFLFFS